MRKMDTLCVALLNACYNPKFKDLKNALLQELLKLVLERDNSR